MDNVKVHVNVYCAKTGISKKYIAEQMNMPYTTFNAKLSGISEFRFSEACKLATIIGCTADELTEPVD